MIGFGNWVVMGFDNRVVMDLVNEFSYCILVMSLVMSLVMLLGDGFIEGFCRFCFFVNPLENRNQTHPGC